MDMDKELTNKLLKVLKGHLDKGPQNTDKILGSFAFIIWNLCQEPQGQERVDLLTELFTGIMENESEERRNR